MSVFLRSFIYQGCKKCNCDRRHCVQDWGYAMHLKLQSIFAAFSLSLLCYIRWEKKKDFNNITLQVKGTSPSSWNNKGNFHTINASDLFIWWHGSCVYVSVCAYELKKYFVCNWQYYLYYTWQYYLPHQSVHLSCDQSPWTLTDQCPVKNKYIFSQ